MRHLLHVGQVLHGGGDSGAALGLFEFVVRLGVVAPYGTRNAVTELLKEGSQDSKAVSA